MFKAFLKNALRWTVASILLFTHMAANADGFSSCDFPCDTNQCCEGFFGNADYLYWKIESSPESVPLVIQGPALAVPQPVLGSPDTAVVLGGNDIDTGWRSGGRFALGYWLDCNHCFGAEVGYFFMPATSKKYTAASDGSSNSPLLLVPFYNVVAAAEDSTAIASPLLHFGTTATLKLVNEMQGVEFNALTTLPFCPDAGKLTGQAGFRYWNFNEHLTFATSSPYLPPHPADTYQTKDKFSTENNFYGGQLGLVWEGNCGGLTMTAKCKVALGMMCEKLTIHGHLLTNDYDDFSAILAYSGGYFALPTNIGKHRQTKFAAIPELTFDFGYRLLDCMQLKLGYTVMYVSQVLWAGKQLDRHINPTQATTYTNALPPLLVGQPSPKARLKTESLWVQGLNAGVQFNF